MVFIWLNARRAIDAGTAPPVITVDKVVMEPSLDEAIADLFGHQKPLEVFGRIPH
nr:hypothetical protein [uncultured Rhodopila sp.]